MFWILIRTHKSFHDEAAQIDQVIMVSVRVKVKNLKNLYDSTSEKFENSFFSNRFMNL